jgi:hypothetical protein
MAIVIFKWLFMAKNATMLKDRMGIKLKELS